MLSKLKALLGLHLVTYKTNAAAQHECDNRISGWRIACFHERDKYAYYDQDGVCDLSYFRGKLGPEEGRRSQVSHGHVLDWRRLGEQVRLPLRP